MHLCKCVVMQFCNANLKCIYVTEPLLSRSVPKWLLKWNYTQCADEASVVIAQKTRGRSVWFVGTKEIIEIWLAAGKGAATHLVQKEMISLNPASSGVSRAAVNLHNRLDVHWVLLDMAKTFSQSRGSCVYYFVHMWVNLPAKSISALCIHLCLSVFWADLLLWTP